MSIEKQEWYIVKQKDRMLKFCYDRKMGIYYQIHMQLGWSEKRLIYKDCLPHFFVLGGINEVIYIFCQDISGDIKLCILEGSELNNRTLLFQKQNIIMPVNFKAFMIGNEVHLLYNIINQSSKSELLVHHPFTSNDKQSAPQIIAKLDYGSDNNYGLTQGDGDGDGDGDGHDNNVYLITTYKTETYKLILKIFYSAFEKWGKEEVLYSSSFPYIDFAIFIEKNTIHNLFVIKEQQSDRVIYMYREREFKKTTILFEKKEVNSCSLIVAQDYVWTFWMCSNKLYGAISIDRGYHFTKPKVYKQFDGIMPIKIMFQDRSRKNYNNYPYLTYGLERNDEISLFLEELLVDTLAEVIGDEEYIMGRLNSENVELDEIRAYLKKVAIKIEALNNEKEEIEHRFKVAEREIINLNEVIENEKLATKKIKYQVSKEKDKNQLLQKDIEKLENKNIMLENNISSKDKELMNFKNKLVEHEREREREHERELSEKNLKAQLRSYEESEISDSTKMKETIEVGKKGNRFSLIKWLLS